MYKCPFCKSTNCEEVRDYGSSSRAIQGLPTNSYKDDFIEFVRNDCGIVTKIAHRIYKVAEE